MESIGIINQDPKVSKDVRVFARLFRPASPIPPLRFLEAAQKGEQLIVDDCPAAVIHQRAHLANKSDPRRC